MQKQNIPKELADLDQWVCYKKEENSDGKLTKIPIIPGASRKAKANDPKTWRDFRTALQWYQDEKADGIGFVFSPDDPYCGIDLDKCRNPDTEEVQQWALDILKQLSSYSEVSQSGSGIHIIVKAKLTGSGTKKVMPGTDHEVEIYDRGRYFVMTANRLSQYPSTAQPRQDQVLELYRGVNPPDSTPQRKQSPPASSSSIPDDHILKKLGAATNAQKFLDLMAGKWESYGYPSESEADAALAALIGFYTQDMDQIFRIIQDSELYDDKWDREDYRSSTINGALGKLPEFYNWQRDPQYAKEDDSKSEDQKGKSKTSHVYGRDGCYWGHRKVGKKDSDTYIDIPISNFTIGVRRSIATPEEVVRQVVFKGTDGSESALVDLRASSMVTLTEFKKFCLSHGNYFWDGTSDELRELLEVELSKNPGLIYQPDRIGYISSGKFWLFGNLAIPEGGNPIYPDKEGVIWVNEKGYLAIAFEEAEDGTVLPVVSVRADADSYTESVLDAMYKNLNFNGWIGLGFCAAHVYLPEIAAEFNCFPELFLFGKLKVGKNVLGRWLLSFFGLSCPEKTISETSRNWIARALAYYSCFPVWLDEYRNDRQIREKNGVLRNAFDRIGSGKGQLGFGGSGYPVRGSVMLSGQVLPDDSALLSRCCVIRLTRQERHDDHYNDVNTLAADLSSLLVHLIRHKTPESIRDTLQCIRTHRDKLIEYGIDDRDATIYGIIAAGVGLLCRDKIRQRQFTEWLYHKEAPRDKAAKEEEDELAVFLEDLTVLIDEGKVGPSQYKVERESETLYLYLWWAAVYKKWSEDYNRRTRETPFSKSALLEYFRETDYYVDHNLPKWIGTIGQDGTTRGTNRRCLKLNLEKMDDHIKSAFVKDAPP